MARARQLCRLIPHLDTLEERAILSALSTYHPIAVPAALTVGTRAIKTDPAGVAAVLSALRGGPGSEFVSLIRRQVPNTNAVIAGFASGRIKEYTTPGVAFKIPAWNPLYTGPKYDHLTVTAAGAILLPGNKLELGAILRGPLDEASPSTYMFALDRGAGSRIGPFFASRPNLKLDAVVVVAVGPYGQNPAAAVVDLTNGSVSYIDGSRIQVTGAVVRVIVDTNLLPSRGLAASKYRFAMWTQIGSGGISQVGSFAPEATMIPIGVAR